MTNNFFSSQMDTHKLVHEPIGGDSYRYFNFAILHSSGLNMVLDSMRYDQAFFCRKSDVEHIVETLEGGKPRFAIMPFSLLLGRFDWRGKTKPNWTPQRLLSGMEYEYIDDPMKLFDLRSEVESWHIKPPAKLKSIVDVTGNPTYILRTMHMNRAFPENEVDAHKIERGFHAPNEAITVRLQTYTNKEREWGFPASCSLKICS